MIKKLKLMFLSVSYILTITLMGGVFSLAPVSVSALDCSNPTSAKERIECGACLTGDTSPDCDPGAAESTLSQTIRNVINVISVLAGAVAVVMIIVGGFRYVTSAGNSETIKNARNTIVYALVGLVIIALAQIIVHFTLNSVA